MQIGLFFKYTSRSTALWMQEVFLCMEINIDASMGIITWYAGQGANSACWPQVIIEQEADIFQNAWGA